MKQPKNQKNPKQAVKPVEEKRKWDIEEWLQKLRWPVFLFFVLALVGGVSNHESWGDEAQGWLLVQDLGLAELIKTLPSEGHPPLWYLILFPFAKMGLPYVTVKWIAAAISVAAVYLLLFRTQMSTLLKIVIPFSYYFFYEYSLFGRSYILGAFFVIAIISLYPRRFDKPLLYALCIVGLFNTHMLYYSFGMSLLGLYVVELLQYKKLSRDTGIAIAVMAIGSLYLVPYFAANDVVNYLGETTSKGMDGIVLLLTGLVPMSGYIYGGLVMLGVLALLLVPRTKALGLLLGGLAGIFYIMTARYSDIQPRHTGIIVCIILGAFAISGFYKDDKWNLPVPDFAKWGPLLLALMFAGQVPQAYFSYMHDAEAVYSGSKDAADFIKEQGLEDKEIVVYHYWAALPILPYLQKDTRFYDIKCNRSTRHYIFDSCYTSKVEFDGADAIYNTKEKFKDRLEDVILVLNFRINLQAAPFLEQIYISPEVAIHTQETYCIYKFNEKAKEM